MQAGEEQESAPESISNASGGVPDSDHDCHDGGGGLERHDCTDADSGADEGDELNELLAIDTAVRPDGDSSTSNPDASDAGTNSQRQRMLRLGGTSQHQTRHAQQQRAEKEEGEDADWAPTQLPELLAASTNVTLERFHANKWREIHQLVRPRVVPRTPSPSTHRDCLAV